MERLTKRDFDFITNFVKSSIDSWSIAQCLNKLQEYENLEEDGLLLKVPQIPKGKTIYWIWGDEIMPCIFKRITSCIVDYSGKVHIMCEMRTKKDRTFAHTYRRRKTEVLIKAGDTRYFYGDEIGKIVFLSRSEAKLKLREKKMASEPESHEKGYSDEGNQNHE